MRWVNAVNLLAEELVSRGPLGTEVIESKTWEYFT